MYDKISYDLWLQDPEATENDKFVAMTLLKNANIASNYILPGCQDTGTAVAIGKRGVHCLTDGKDAEHISRGVYDTYQKSNLRYHYNFFDCDYLV